MSLANLLPDAISAVIATGGGLIFMLLSVMVLCLVYYRYQGKSALIRNSFRTNLLEKATQSGSWELDLRNNKLVFSNSARKLFGIFENGDRSDFEALYYKILPEDRKDFERNWARMLRFPGPVLFHFRMLNSGGDVIHISATADVLERDDTESAQVLFGIFQNTTELKSSRRSTKDSEERYKKLFESAEDCIISVCDGKVQMANPVSRSLFGLEIGSDFFSFIATKDEKRIRAQVGQLNMSYRRSDVVEFTAQDRDKKSRVMRGTVNLVSSSTGEALFILADAGGKRKREMFQHLNSECVKLLNKRSDSPRLVDELLTLIREITGFEAIGFRIRDNDDYPYYSTEGFPNEFVKRENRLMCSKKSSSELACLCGRVISQNIPENCSLFTEKGSLFINSCSKVFGDPNSLRTLGSVRGICNSFGYESVALVPLRNGNEVIGLMQFNDKRANLFEAGLQHFLEELGETIGIAFKRLIEIKEINSARQLAEKSNQETAEHLRQARGLITGKLAKLHSVTRSIESWKLSDPQRRSINQLLGVIQEIENSVESFSTLSLSDSNELSLKHNAFSLHDFFKQLQQQTRTVHKAPVVFNEPLEFPGRLLGDYRLLLKAVSGLIQKAVSMCSGTITLRSSGWMEDNKYRFNLSLTGQHPNPLDRSEGLDETASRRYIKMMGGELHENIEGDTLTLLLSVSFDTLKKPDFEERHSCRVLVIDAEGRENGIQEMLTNLGCQVETVSPDTFKEKRENADFVFIDSRNDPDFALQIAHQLPQSTTRTDKTRFIALTNLEPDARTRFSKLGIHDILSISRDENEILGKIQKILATTKE